MRAYAEMRNAAERIRRRPAVGYEDVGAWLMQVHELEGGLSD
jgi:hypothetical protein